MGGWLPSPKIHFKVQVKAFHNLDEYISSFRQIYFKFIQIHWCLFSSASTNGGGPTSQALLDKSFFALCNSVKRKRNYKNKGKKSNIKASIFWALPHTMLKPVGEKTLLEQVWKLSWSLATTGGLFSWIGYICWLIKLSIWPHFLARRITGW